MFVDLITRLRQVALGGQLTVIIRPLLGVGTDRMCSVTHKTFPNSVPPKRFCSAAQLNEYYCLDFKQAMSQRLKVRKQD